MPRPAAGSLSVMCALLCVGTVRAYEDEVAVAAYLPEWRYEGANWDQITKRSSHLILFSLEITPAGGIGALDRLPRPELMQQAREAATKNGAYLTICFGGNGRSAGFSPMVRSDKARKNFVQNLAALLEKYSLDGVDYNWEYPGYQFGRGYLPEPEVAADYSGLLKLFRETRLKLGTGKQITMSYYPDVRQEQTLSRDGFDKHLDLLFSMSYDQGGTQHSPYELAVKSISQAYDAKLPMDKMCVGVPFYGRSPTTGDWKSYEDIVQQNHPLQPNVDSVPGQAFNGVEMIRKKTVLAIEKGVKGVMIWEVGQDCRLAPVTHGAKTHPATCPEGDQSSLLVAITDAISSKGKKLLRKPGHEASVASQDARQEL